MTEPADWSQIAERGSLLALRVLVGFHRIFGRPFSVVVTHGIAFYYFATDRSVRAASLAYLRRVSSRPEGAAALGRRADWVASFLHVRAFALSILDRMLLWLGRREDFRFDVSGLDEYDRLLAHNQGALVVGSHLGSFDALRALAQRDGRVVNVLMFTRNAKRINTFFEQLAPDVKMRVIQVERGSFGSVLRIRSCVERGELVAMLGDRVGPNDRRSCRVPLLGDPVELPTAPYLLAGLLGCPVFFMVALRAGPGHYRVFAEVLSEGVELPPDTREKQVRELALRYAERLEHYCLIAPCEWFNFYDYWGEGTA